MSVFSAPISEQIWDMKYRLKSPGGASADRSIGGTWRRVARALAEVGQAQGRVSGPILA